MATTIPIEKDTRDRLKRFGSKDETYDEILDRLMDYLEELKVDELIEAKWGALQEEKERYIPLDEV